MESTFRKATAGDTESISAIIASAFYDDPLFSWFFPEASTRQRKLPGFFQYCFPRMMLQHDATWTNADASTAAVWIPPDRWKTSPSEQLRLLPGFVRWLGRRTPRVLNVMSEMDKQHPHDPPSWYLFVLGTATEHQGKGLGSAAMMPVLQRCDDEGVPAYLESSNPRNIPFYARHGFVERPPLDLGPGKPIVTPMWRDPK